MHARTQPRLLPGILLSIALATTGCSSDDDGGSESSLTRSLALAASSFLGAGPLWAIVVPEADEGGLDRNGDGDALDQVLSVFHDDDGAPSSLGLALAFQSGTSLPVVVAGDTLVAFGVSEADQGGLDLNADGDALDAVLHVYDDSDGSVTNTGIALASSFDFAIGLGSVAFAASELGQGMDLDGDGVATDAALHVYDSRTGLTTNALRAVTSPITFHDHAFAFTTDEPSAGVDLNGDGDAVDTRIFELYDLVLGGIESVPLAIVGTPFAVGTDVWFVSVLEAEQGTDLDGDGLLIDAFYHRVEPHIGALENLGLPGDDSLLCALDGDQVAFAVLESDGIDRNVDGDLNDTLPVLYDAAGGPTFEAGLPMDRSVRLEFVGSALAFSVCEDDHELDLNLDGDLGDDVLHVMDRTTGDVTNLGIPQFASFDGARVFLRSESQEGLDLNADGDMDDGILFHLDAETLEVRNTGLVAGFVPFTEDPRTLVLTFDEAVLGADQTGDGDVSDAVYGIYDLETETSVGLGLAIVFEPLARLNADGRGLLAVHESGQGEDLNGDGDLDDRVPFALRLR
jgi:hypothetical protein